MTTTYRRISYHPSAEIDMLKDTEQTGWEGTRVPTLARKRNGPNAYQLMLHANVRILPLENNVDVSRQYRMLRIRRVWVGRLNGEHPIASAYALDKDGADGRLPPGYQVDSNTDFFGDPGGHWVDCPNHTHQPGDPVNERWLNEFVVGIGDPLKARTPIVGFGGIYFLVAIDVTRERYRVWMSLERRLSDADIQGVFRVPGFACPPWIAGAAPPDITAFRYVPHGWQDYTAYLK